MKPSHPVSDETLLEATRGLASRHTAIPPTPRDTMAVLRQAAGEQRHAPARFFLAPRMRWAAGVATLAILLTLGWWLRPAGDQHPETASIAIASEPDDEFEAFWGEINETLALLDDEEAWL